MHNRTFVIASLWLMGCGPGGASDTSSDGSDTETTGTTPQCTPPPGCDETMPGEYPLEGWFTQEGPTQIFASRPGVACGNSHPPPCDSCGNYDAINLSLESEPIAGQIYPLGTDAVGLYCESWISDCMGNGGGEGDQVQVGEIEILSVTDTCITGRVMADGCGEMDFKAARCD